jgi:hypothetical protein
MKYLAHNLNKALELIVIRLTLKVGCGGWI